MKIIFLLLFFYQIGPAKPVLDTTPNLIQFVNPLIGTKKMGHTFPGATTPFGMVQLSPETNNPPMFIDKKYNPEVYQYCSGYQYDDQYIIGFSHTHFSGTGHSDLGDFLIMPVTGKIDLDSVEKNNPDKQLGSKFHHNTEISQPAYYKVTLEDHSIIAELTATDRVGFHQYTFPQSDEVNIVLDMIHNIYQHEDKNVWVFVRVENDSTVTGYRITTGWGRTRTVYFAMQFSKPFKSYGQKKYDDFTYKGFYRRFNESENFPEMTGKNIRAYFSFSTEKDEKIKIKFALSSVSSSGALKNLEKEIPHWDFEKTKSQSQSKWNQELSKILIETIEPEDKITFYTALYHTMLSPVLYEDTDGSYRGLDQEIHISEGFTNYTIFSLWDTYRALHPLFNIFHPSKNNDMMKSMLAHHDQSVHKMLPVWSHYANENWCMIGYHSVSALADAIVKGTTDIDLNKALAACINTSTVKYYDGLDYYMTWGFVPEDKSANSVSKTLEFAYDDWCIAQIAKKAKNNEVYENYIKRSESYKNVYDKYSGFMRPRLENGQWKEKFDPLDTHGQGFIEGNALNYGLYVPQAIDSMIEMMGGKDKFSKHLDRIFTTVLDEKYIEKNEDITRDGIIGAYVHGNEPGHHIPYLYNWTDEPWKTQERVRMIMNSMYSSEPDGLCGNDDAGQMSAWYIFSALGFYPVLPGSDQYALGSPLVKSALLSFENGKKLKIRTTGQGKNNVYIQRIEFNGKTINRHYLSHAELTDGGELVFYLSDKPVRKKEEMK
ncbi:MAG: GH92 family glycosyl hydrolase [Saprospiraceae bacterium]|nr:GH92 family glycosyl hydrolase [Saprospiraceae bacterium]